jgi:hypothetical protein
MMFSGGQFDDSYHAWVGGSSVVSQLNDTRSCSSQPANLPALTERIARLEQSLDYFYPLKDRGQRPLTGGNVHIGQLIASEGPFKDAVP